MSGDDDQITQIQLRYLHDQVAALWQALADVQTQIAQIHENRIKALLTAESVPAKKLN
jgi:hypothetical protein